MPLGLRLLRIRIPQIKAVVEEGAFVIAQLLDPVSCPLFGLTKPNAAVQVIGIPIVPYPFAGGGAELVLNTQGLPVRLDPSLKQGLAPDQGLMGYFQHAPGALTFVPCHKSTLG